MPAMIEALGAVLSALLLVPLSMVGGGILYVIVKDLVKRNIRKPD
jgi:hypothetical protein